MSISNSPRQSSSSIDSNARPKSAHPKVVFLKRIWRKLFAISIFAVCLVASKNWWGNASIEWLARRALVARQPEQALVWISRGAIIANPNGDLLLLRARAQRQLGQLGELNTTLEQAAKCGASAKKIRLETDLAMAQSGQLSVVEAKLPQLLIDADADASDVCEAFVIGYLRTHRFGNALQLLKAWIDDSPKDPQPLLLRSRIWMVEIKLKRAEEDLRRAHELAPKQSEITYELAYVLKQLNRWSEAVTLYESCLNHAKWSAKAKLGLGLCHKALGDSAASERFLKDAVQEAPQNAEALRDYGRHLEENGRYAEATEVLRHAVELLPYDDELHYLLAQALQLQGDKDGAAPHFSYVTEARAAFRELMLIQDRLRKDPQNIELMTRAGEIQLQYSDPEEGVVRLMAVLDQQPTNQRARKLLADHYTKRATTHPAFASLAEEHRRWLQPPTTKSDDAPTSTTSGGSP